MSDDRKSRVLLDAGLFVVPLILVCAGIYLSFIRVPKSGVAVLNMDRVLQETGVADRVRDAERRFMNTIVPQINESTERARTQGAALEAQLARTTDDAAKKLLQEKIRRIQTETQTAVDRSRQEFLLYREGVKRDIRAKLDPVVRTIARAGRYDVVVDSGDGRTVVYVRTAVDITDQVIKDARSILATAEFGVGGPETGKPAVPPRMDIGEPIGGAVK